jgi:transcriptional regulator with XRE-family HTH domain
MTPIRRLLNIVQFDLAEKLNLARLRWYHLNHQDQYLQSVIYGNPDNCTLFRLREVLTNLLRANFLNDDQGYESGISMYGHYIACKCLDISSEEEYMNQLTDIKLICNEL